MVGYGGSGAVDGALGSFATLCLNSGMAKVRSDIGDGKTALCG